MTAPTHDPPRRGRRAAAEEPARSTGTPAWLPVLARVALLPPAVCYGIAVVVAGVVAALASGTTPGGEPGLGQALAVGIPLWLVAHLVPLQVTGVPLGVLPLTPAILLAVLVAGVARGGGGHDRHEDAVQGPGVARPRPQPSDRAAGDAGDQDGEQDRGRQR